MIPRFLPLFLLLFLTACSNPKADKQAITIFHAGSLTLPIRAAADSFKRYHPDVSFNLEAAGSVECARKITELNRQCNLFFSADYKVIKNLLVTRHAKFFIPFASNKMVLAYTQNSKHSNIINASNWFSILLRPDVQYGRSDPNADPCGYRTLILLQLAEKYYEKIGLLDSLVAKDNEFIRPKEVDLLALLETSTIDYLFIYESLAIQHSLTYINLPDSINLGNPSLDKFYSSAKVIIRGISPGDSITISGEPITYAFTIPYNAPNQKLAIEFAQYFLSDTGGMAIVARMGQQSLIPFSCSDCGNIPVELMSNSVTNNLDGKKP